MTSLGCYWYVGKTQSGKTTRALRDLVRDAEVTGWPCLIVDSAGAANFDRWSHVESPKEALEGLYGLGGHVVITPSGIEEMDQLLRGVRKGGRVHVLVDEARWWLSARRITEDMTRALRCWAQSEVTYRLTTQRPSDIHGDAFACDPEVYVFRTDGQADLKRIEDEWGFPPEKVLSLPRYECLVRKRGFET